MRLSVKKVAFVILGVYFVVSCYTGYVLVRRRINKEAYELQRLRALTEFTEDDRDWNPWGEEFEQEEPLVVPKYQPPKILWNVNNNKQSPETVHNTSAEFIVEIWGKAAIGLYLWEHIFDSELERKLGGVWSYGVKNIKNIEFRYRTGPGIIISKVPKYTQNLVLILNGREKSKIDYSKQWLDFLPSLPNLKNVGVVLLGNEQCDNDWIKPYMEMNGGRIRFVFLVYDSPDIDNKNFYQWPLGVATYRYFPKVNSAYLPTATHRKYVCNFLGTVYKNSSREVLMSILEPESHGCYIKARNEWLPQETDDTREDYLRALAKSDLTLNPVGKNTECYRIYEAMSYGSVPVIEDVMTPGNCGTSKISKHIPLRLLKEEKAPVIYIKNWNELKDILNKESLLSQEDKAKRRRDLILWHESFKSKMRDRFVQVVEERFFYARRR